jgi:hypothetical protein
MSGTPDVSRALGGLLGAVAVDPRGAGILVRQVALLVDGRSVGVAALLVAEILVGGDVTLVEHLLARDDVAAVGVAALDVVCDGVAADVLLMLSIHVMHLLS